MFRQSVVGPLMVRSFAHGELRAELEKLSQQCYRLPDADRTRRFSAPTIERWYYAAKTGGIDALCPSPRADKGRGRCFDDATRELLCDIRREHPSASVPLILRTLIEEGRLDQDAHKHESVVRKLFADRGLLRCSARVETSQGDSAGTTRLRWEAEHPGALWHGDVCHFAITEGGVRKPVRIHGMLDDASRFVVALEARWTEKEVDMLALFVDALKRLGLPDGLFLDNGATYIGEILATACSRLGIVLVHAKPHDPRARGKMERFWRTLREAMLDFCKGEMTLELLNERLAAFVDRYHDTPHAGLLGRTPRSVFRAYVRNDELTEDKLREALTVRENRRVSHDNVLSIDGTDWELQQGFLAGKRVTIVRSWYEPKAPPAVEIEGRRLPLIPVDAKRNGQRKRPPRGEAPAPAKAKTGFDPAATLARTAKKTGGAS
jgi:transposase InsO family protein